MLAANKADGDNIARDKAAAAEYREALHIIGAGSELWTPPVMTFSALTGEGITELWGKICEHRERTSAAGAHAARRREQQVKWMWAMLEERMMARLKSDPSLRARLPKFEAAVVEGRTSPAVAVEELAQSLGL